MVLNQVFSPESIILNLQSTEKTQLFEEMLDSLVKANPSIDKQQALSAVCERESKMSTGIMHNIAVPHGNCECVKSTVGVIGISQKGIDYDSLDNTPVHLVFMLISPVAETEMHLSVLRDLAAILQDPSFVKQIKEKQSAQEVYDLLCEYAGQ